MRDLGKSFCHPWLMDVALCLRCALGRLFSTPRQWGGNETIENGTVFGERWAFRELHVAWTFSRLVFSLSIHEVERTAWAEHVWERTTRHLPQVYVVFGSHDVFKTPSASDCRSSRVSIDAWERCWVLESQPRMDK